MGDDIKFAATDTYDLCEEVWAAEERHEKLRKMRERIERMMFNNDQRRLRIKREIARRDKLHVLEKGK